MLLLTGPLPFFLMVMWTVVSGVLEFQNNRCDMGSVILCQHSCANLKYYEGLVCYFFCNLFSLFFPGISSSFGLFFVCGLVLKTEFYYITCAGTEESMFLPQSKWGLWLCNIMNSSILSWCVCVHMWYFAYTCVHVHQKMTLGVVLQVPSTFFQSLSRLGLQTSQS